MQAVRRVQEQAAVQQMQFLMEQRNLEIQERADMAKAVQSAQMATMPTVMVPGPNGEGSFEVPNPQPLSQEEAAFRFVLPTVAKYRPDKVPNVIESIATAKYRNFNPRGEQVTLPGGGTVQGIRTSPNQFTPVIDPTVQTLQRPDGSTVDVIRSGTSGVRPIPQDIGARQQKTMMAKWALENAPELMVIDPDTGFASLPPENFNEAARRSGIPSAVKTQMNEQMVNAAAAFDVGRKLMPLLTPQNVGVPGAFQRTIVDKGLAQVFPQMRIGTSTEMLSVASNFRAGLVRALRSDGNINKDEREQIIEGLPTPDQMMSSVQDSKVKLATQIELAAIKSRSAANTLGKPITPFYLNLPEIEQMVGSGSVTPEEGAQLWNSSAWNFIDTIRADVQK